MMNTLWVLVTLIFLGIVGFVFHYYSSKVINNLVRILNLLTLIADQLKAVNIVLIEKAKLNKAEEERQQ